MWLIGIGLFYAGWSSIEKSPERERGNAGTKLVVRPLGTSLSREQSAESTKQALGEFQLVDYKSQLDIRKPSWKTATLSLDPGCPIKTVRLEAPEATFNPITEDGTRVDLKTLPTKTKLERSEGTYSLQPGRHEFVASAEGHLPDSLSVFLRPGEDKKLVVSLKELPKPPVLRRRQPRPRRSTYRPSRPTRPTYRPRRPVPKFTPVAAPAKPRPRDPVPLFTPVP